MRRTTATDVTESHATCFVQQNKTSYVMPSKCLNVPWAQREGPELRSSTVRVFAILQMVRQSTGYITYSSTNKCLQKVSPVLQIHSSGNRICTALDGRTQGTEHTVPYIKRSITSPSLHDSSLLTGNGEEESSGGDRSVECLKLRHETNSKDDWAPWHAPRGYTRTETWWLFLLCGTGWGVWKNCGLIYISSLK